MHSNSFTIQATSSPWLGFGGVGPSISAAFNSTFNAAREERCEDEMLRTKTHSSNCNIFPLLRPWNRSIDQFCLLSFSWTLTPSCLLPPLPPRPWLRDFIIRPISARKKVFEVKFSPSINFPSAPLSRSWFDKKSMETNLWKLQILERDKQTERERERGLKGMQKFSFLNSTAKEIRLEISSRAENDPKESAKKSLTRDFCSEQNRKRCTNDNSSLSPSPWPGQCWSSTQSILQ